MFSRLIIPIAFRLSTHDPKGLTLDPTFREVLFVVWTQVEMHLSLILATIPVLRPVIKSFNTSYKLALSAQLDLRLPTRHQPGPTNCLRWGKRLPVLRDVKRRGALIAVASTQLLPLLPSHLRSNRKTHQANLDRTQIALKVMAVNR